MRLPCISGVGGGVGTTTLAAALRATDCGIYRQGAPIDVLVCRTSMSSVGAAQRALGVVPHPPVLAVVADAASAASAIGLSRQLRARLRMTEPHVSGVVFVPFVPTWRDIDDPWQEAMRVLVDPPSRSTKGFRQAVEALVAMLLPRVAPNPGQSLPPDPRVDPSAFDRPGAPLRPIST